MAVLRKTRRQVWYEERLNPEGWLGFAAGMCGVVTLITFLFCLADYETDIDDYNTASGARVEMVKKFDKLDADDRQAAARSILRLDKRGFDTPLNNVGEDKSRVAEVRDQLRHVAATGEALTLDDSKRSWNHFWGWIFILLIGSALSVYMAICFITYAIQCVGRREFLMDLPWRRVWPFFYVLATVWPLGWLFYPVSAVRTYRANKHYRHEETAGQAEPNLDIEYVDNDELNAIRRNDTPPRQKQVKFNHEPNAARRLYFELRNGGWRTYMQGKVAELRESKQIVEDDLEECGREMRQLQQRRGELAAELRELENTVIPDEPIEATALEAEFNRLLKLPGVQAVRVVNDNLSLFVKARLNYEGVVYDLGDWDLRIGGSVKYSAKELRSGVRESWYGGYPVYRWSDDLFCFGARYNAIEENLRKGQLLEAAELAVNCINSVNDEELYRVPEAFYEESKEEVA